MDIEFYARKGYIEMIEQGVDAMNRHLARTLDLKHSDGDRATYNIAKDDLEHNISHLGDLVRQMGHETKALDMMVLEDREYSFERTRMTEADEHPDSVYITYTYADMGTAVRFANENGLKIRALKPPTEMVAEMPYEPDKRITKEELRMLYHGHFTRINHRIVKAG